MLACGSIGKNCGLARRVMLIAVGLAIASAVIASLTIESRKKFG